LLFQTLDHKKECIGVFVDGKLNFDNIPNNLTKTWKASSSVRKPNTEYAWIYAAGMDLDEVCPEEMKSELSDLSRKFKAYVKAFSIANVPMDEVCFFDLVPQRFLLDWCGIKNYISQHIFETYKRPKNHDHLARIHELLVDISNQKLNLNTDGCRSLFISSRVRPQVQKILDLPPYLHYNLYGTVTGRLTTLTKGQGLLSMEKKLRKLLKPNNDWFISFDYNGADVRTFLGLLGEEQPQEDIHEWNSRHLFGGSLMGKKGIDREEAKVGFFTWLYSPRDTTFEKSIYNRKTVLDKFYFDGAVINPFDRKIEVDEERALSYLVQSTTNDLTLDRAVAISKALEGRASYVSHLMHDEVVIDFSDEDRDLLPELKSIFADTKLGKFMTNVTAGKNYLEMNELNL
jgi:hypothetical protein